VGRIFPGLNEMDECWEFGSLFCQSCGQFGRATLGGLREFWKLCKATVMKYDYPEGIPGHDKQEFKVFPDPAKNEITVEIPGLTVMSNLIIQNIAGQELSNQPVTGSSIQINISNLPDGIYFVRGVSDLKVETGKFLKN
jgi:Secretion system C-terminal sorting domain